MTEAVDIQPALPKDAPAIANLCREEIELGFGWRWRAGAIARMMARPDTEVAVVRGPGDVMAGFGIMELGPEDAELILFATDPRFRRRGLGRLLLDFLEDEARDAGLESVWLHVRAENRAAVTFYEMKGYRIREHLSGHYGNREDAFRMQHRLIEARVESHDLLDLGALLRGG